MCARAHVGFLAVCACVRRSHASPPPTHTSPERKRKQQLPHAAGLRVQEGSWAHYGLGLRLLGAMVQEANSPTPHRTLTQHRKVAVGFRDACLLQIFQLSLRALEELPGTGPGAVLAEPALRLAVACLGFDFVGTSMDDSVDDLGTIQVPTPWRALLEQPDTMTLFWRCYSAHEPPLSNLALEALVRVSGVGGGG